MKRKSKTIPKTPITNPQTNQHRCVSPQSSPPRQRPWPSPSKQEDNALTGRRAETPSRGSATRPAATPGSGTPATRARPSRSTRTASCGRRGRTRRPSGTCASGTSRAATSASQRRRPTTRNFAGSRRTGVTISRICGGGRSGPGERIEVPWIMLLGACYFVTFRPPRDACNLFSIASH